MRKRDKNDWKKYRYTHTQTVNERMWKGLWRGFRPVLERKLTTTGMKIMKIMIIMMIMELPTVTFFLLWPKQNKRKPLLFFILLVITRPASLFPFVVRWRWFPYRRPQHGIEGLRGTRVLVCDSQGTQAKGEPRVHRILGAALLRWRKWWWCCRVRVWYYLLHGWCITPIHECTAFSLPHQHTSFTSPINTLSHCPIINPPLPSPSLSLFFLQWGRQFKGINK